MSTKFTPCLIRLTALLGAVLIHFSAFAQIVAPKGAAPRSFRRHATKTAPLNSANRLSTNRLPGLSTQGLANPQWEFLGPKNAYPNNPFGMGALDAIYTGRVNRVAYDDQIIGVVYLTSPGGGVWKSIDSGVTWSPIGDFLSTLTVTAVAASNDLVLVGTGDYESPGHGVSSNGIFRSTDGGQTFSTVTPKGLPSYPISAITIDPDDPDFVLLTSGRGGSSISFTLPDTKGGFFYPDYLGFMYRSVDGGKTFLKAKVPGSRGQGDWSDVKYSIPNSRGVRTYFAACSWPVNAQAPKVYISSDKGANWSSISLPIGNGSIAFSIYPNRLAVAPSAVDPKVVYLMWGDDGVTGTVKIWKGVQQRNPASFAWMDITGNAPTEPFQSSYSMQLRAAPFVDSNGDTKDIVYAGTIGLGASFGDGDWFDISHSLSGDDTIHANLHDITFDPFNPNQLIAATDGGIYGLTVDNVAFDPALKDKNWTIDGLLNQTLGLTQFYFADFSAIDPTILLGGADNNATPASTGDLDLWSNVGVLTGGGVAINPLDPLNQYSSNQYYDFLYRTRDGWQTADQIDLATYDFYYWYVFNFFENPPLVGQITHDPNRNAIYIASDYLWRYDADLELWEPDLGNQALAGYGSNIKCIAIAPSDSNYIYTGSTDGQLWMSSDGGVSFTPLTANNLPFGVITGINIHPTNPNDILISFGGNGNLYQCKDTSAPKLKFDYKTGYGITRLPLVNANDIARDLLDPDNKWFVGTDTGVYYTPTAGVDWGNANPVLGLPNVQVTTLKAISETKFLMASTFGRGIWRLDISNGVTVPIADSIGFSLTLAGFQRQGRTISAKLTITNDRDVTASQIQFDTMTVSAGARAVKAQPIPLNVGAIPGSKSGSKYFIVKNITFPTLGRSGDKATLTVTGTLINDGPRTFTRTVDFVIP